jgi:hypothetical protein
MPGPHGFAVRFSAVRQRALDRSQAKARPAISLRARRCRVHRIPYPTSVTIAIRPSEGRDGEGCRFDLGLSKTEIFLKRGLDRQISDLPVGPRDWAKFRKNIVGNEDYRCGSRSKLGMPSGI